MGLEPDGMSRRSENPISNAARERVYIDYHVPIDQDFLSMTLSQLYRDLEEVDNARGLKFYAVTRSKRD
jgi:hypothetical protein